MNDFEQGRDQALANVDAILLDELGHVNRTPISHNPLVLDHEHSLLVRLRGRIKALTPPATSIRIIGTAIAESLVTEEFFRPPETAETCAETCAMNPTTANLICECCGEHRAIGVASSFCPVSAAFCTCCLQAGLQPPYLLRAAEQINDGRENLQEDLRDLLTMLETGAVNTSGG